jgi:glutaconyl-CoA/methylmalonyl-CoA decarboxylase subunit delta
MSMIQIYYYFGMVTTQALQYKDKFKKIIFDFSKIGEMDGYSIAAYSFLIVFIALTIIVLFFLVTGRISFALDAKKLNPIQIAKIPKEKTEMNNDVHAAICMALFLHMEDTHDDESGVITIEKIERRYSPWSSKIYNISKKPF